MTGDRPAPSRPTPQTDQRTPPPRPQCEGCGKRSGGGLRYCYACLCLIFDHRDPQIWEHYFDRRSREWVVRRRETHEREPSTRLPQDTHKPPRRTRKSQHGLCQETSEQSVQQKAATQNKAVSKSAGRKVPTQGARTVAKVIMNGATEISTAIGKQNEEQIAELIDRLLTSSEPDAECQPLLADGAAESLFKNTPQRKRSNT